MQTSEAARSDKLGTGDGRGGTRPPLSLINARWRTSAAGESGVQMDDHLSYRSGEFPSTTKVPCSTTVPPV